MTKKNRSPSNKSPPLDGEEQEQYSERNTWSPQDTDAFHYVLSKYTSFNDGKLELSHRYFDARDISLVEKMDTKRMANRAAGKDGPSDEDILLELKRTNDGNSAKNYKIVFSLLRELQAAVGGRYTVRQINTKMINSRSRWSVPFQSLHEVGYLIKNQAARGGRRTDSVTGNFINPPRTNIEKKNLAAIKALLKYCTNRHTFWNDEAGAKPFNNMYSGQSTSSIVMLPSDATEDIPEPERFIRAMIKRHGVNMVKFMDQCLVNICNSYRHEKIESGQWDGQYHPINTLETPRTTLAAILTKIVDDVVMLPKPTRKAKSMESNGEPSNSLSNASTGRQGLGNNAHEALPSSFSNVVTGLPLLKRSNTIESGNENSTKNERLQRTNSKRNKNESTLKHNYDEVGEGASNHGYGDDNEFSQLKRSKSLVMPESFLFSNSHNDGHNEANFGNLPIYSEMNGFGGMMTAEGMTPKAPYEDDYLSQYINFNTSFTAPVTSTGITSADINAVLNGYGGDEGSSYPDNGSNGRNDMGSTPPGGILEGIGNLTVNGHSEVHTPVKGKNPIAGNPGQKHYSHYEETNSKAQRVSDDIGYPSISQRRHSHAAGLPYNALPLGFGHPLPAQNPLFLENSLSGDQSLRGLRNQEWSSNDRLSTSTGNAAAPVGAGTSMDNKSAFTFNIPNSWSDETSVNEPPMQTPTYQGNFGMSHQQQQGVSFSTAMLAQLPATLDNYRIPNFNDASEQLQQRRQSVHQSINIPDGNGMQSQASFVPAMSNQVTKVSLNPVGEGPNKMSATLVMVNNVASRVELLYNNGGPHQTPIVIPIAQVVNDNN